MGGGRSSVDRVDYSNDTATASPRGDSHPLARKLQQQVILLMDIGVVVIIINQQ